MLNSVNTIMCERQGLLTEMVDVLQEEHRNLQADKALAVKQERKKLKLLENAFLRKKVMWEASHSARREEAEYLKLELAKVKAKLRRTAARDREENDLRIELNLKCELAQARQNAADLEQRLARCTSEGVRLRTALKLALRQKMKMKSELELENKEMRSELVQLRTKLGQTLAEDKLI